MGLEYSFERIALRVVNFRGPFPNQRAFNLLNLSNTNLSFASLQLLYPGNYGHLYNVTNNFFFSFTMEPEVFFLSWFNSFAQQYS